MCEVYKSETGITVEPLYVPNADYTTKCVLADRFQLRPDIAYIFTTDVYKWAMKDCLWMFTRCWTKTRITLMTISSPGVPGI